MKKLFTAALIACSFVALARFGWENIKGSGQLKKETRQVADFTGVSSRGSMDVNITYGNSNSIEVEADDNLLPLIETVVEKGNLVIRSKDKTGFSTRNKITVSIQMTKLEEAAISGSGDIKGTGAFTNSGKTVLAISGSGNINLEFGNFETVDARVSGSGNIFLAKGNVKTVDAHISGSGKMDASNSAFEELEAQISGSGNIKAHVNKKIHARISGSGTIYYSGNATDISSKTSGSGRIVKM